MSKTLKENIIKLWLQKFGDRDNESFTTEVIIGNTTWSLSLEYSFSDEGDQLEPYDYCRSSFKHLFENTISDRSEAELDQIISILKTGK